MVYTEDLENDPRFDKLREKGVCSRVALCLMAKGKLYGVLSIDSPNINGFSKDEIALLERLAHYADIAIENAMAFRERDAFLVALEHEMVAPLAGMTAHCEEIYKNYPKIEKERIEYLWSECEHINLLIERVMLLEEGIDPKKFVKEKTCIFRDVIDRCISLLKPSAKERGIEIKVEGKREIPQLLIDPSAFKQVVYNILHDGIKYSDRGSVIEIVGKTEDGIFKICFSNYGGIGVVQGEEGLIFEKLKRGSNAGLRDPSRIGLGLFIAREIVRAHGGELKLTKNRYPTTFTIFMPINRFLDV